MKLNTLEILRKELVGKKLIMYDNVLLYNKLDISKKVTIGRTFQPSEKERIENKRIELVITNVNEANRDSRAQNGCHLQIEIGLDNYPIYYYSNFEIED